MKLLKHIATEKKYEIEINTVDQYQGRDKDVIIYSCTKHSNNNVSILLKQFIIFAVKVDICF